MEMLAVVLIIAVCVVGGYAQLHIFRVVADPSDGDGPGKAKDDDSGVEATSKGVGKREVEWINHHGEPEPRAFLPVSVRPYFV